MTGDDIGQLVYLVLLLTVVGGYVMFDFRRNLSRRLQQLAIWALIFLGVLAAVGLWADIRSTVLPSQKVIAENRIEVPKAPDGHFYLTAKVNGKPIRFIVDTGATTIALSREDARKAGINTSDMAFIGRASTANGMIRTAPVRLATMDLGPIHDTNVPASVNAAEMDGSLLGMTYLSKFARIELSADKLILER
ncbi:TIGR02281 family clan AA aspartic protease [Thioclava litoralis]|uniref:TIGR02281 family clan AA aspartic protease n=1 Tax=Thioclava litoralis TaxID=3076557 RepID=A0ABZ1DWJ7_9RHOB|nr:TIGR02281 family clan AA aspartic protease [Thioclava sp. FTW29]